MNVPQHVGRAAIVIGGGPSTPADYRIAAAALPDAVVLSANQHGFLLAPFVDYAVHTDETHSIAKQRMDMFLRRYGAAKIVGRFEFDDIRIDGYPRHCIDSGFLACLVAHNMGCDPVVPCGFGRWAEGFGQQYFHDKDTARATRQVRMFGNDTFVHTKVQLPRLRIISGPLLKLYPTFKPETMSHF